VEEEEEEEEERGLMLGIMTPTSLSRNPQSFKPETLRPQPSTPSSNPSALNATVSSDVGIPDPVGVGSREGRDGGRNRNSDDYSREERRVSHR
jgi:hypothetical protein